MTDEPCAYTYASAIRQIDEVSEGLKRIQQAMTFALADLDALRGMVARLARDTPVGKDERHG